MRLEDQVIVITEASSGVGKAMADAFVEEGAHVVCTSSDESELDDMVDAINNGQGEAIGIAADISDSADVDHLIDRTQDEYGAVDVCMNTAAISHAGDDVERWRVDEQPVEAWDGIVATTMKGTFLCSRTILQGMRDRGRGRLIHLTTGLGRHGRPEWGPVVASTHAIEGLHRTITAESAGTGVDSILLRTPRGGIPMESETSESTFGPTIIAEPAVLLAAGAGENGGNYVVTEDGESFASRDEDDLWPLVDTREQIGPGDTLSWSVDLHPRDELVVEARLIEGAAPAIKIEDPDGATVGTVEDIGMGEQVRQQITAETEGQYQIDFHNQASLASGQWDIAVSLRDEDTNT